MVPHGLQNGSSIFCRVGYTAVLALCPDWSVFVNVGSGIHPETAVENMEGENIAIG